MSISWHIIACACDMLQAIYIVFDHGEAGPQLHSTAPAGQQARGRHSAALSLDERQCSHLDLKIGP